MASTAAASTVASPNDTSHIPAPQNAGGAPQFPTMDGLPEGSPTHAATTATDASSAYAPTRPGGPRPPGQLGDDRIMNAPRALPHDGGNSPSHATWSPGDYGDEEKMGKISPKKIARLRKEMDMKYRIANVDPNNANYISEWDLRKRLPTVDRCYKEIEYVKNQYDDMLEQIQDQWDQDNVAQWELTDKRFEEVKRLQAALKQENYNYQQKMNQETSDHQVERLKLEEKISDLQMKLNDTKVSLWREVKELTAELTENKERRVASEETLRALKGKKAHCVVCQFVSFNEKVAGKLEKANVDVREDLGKTIRQRDGLQHAYDETSKKLEDCLKELEKKAAAHAKLAAEMHLIKEELKMQHEIKQQLTDTLKKLHKTKYELAELQRSSQAAFIELETLKLKYAALERLNNETQAKFNGLMDQIRYLKMDMKVLENEKKALEKELKETKERLAWVTSICLRMRAKWLYKMGFDQSDNQAYLKRIFWGWKDWITDRSSVMWNTIWDRLENEERLIELRKKLEAEIQFLAEKLKQTRAELKMVTEDRDRKKERLEYLEPKHAETVQLLEETIDHLNKLKKEHDDLLAKHKALNVRCDKLETANENLKLEKAEQLLMLKKKDRIIEELKRENEFYAARMGVMCCGEHLWKPRQPLGYEKEIRKPIFPEDQATRLKEQQEIDEWMNNPDNPTCVEVEDDGSDAAPAPAATGAEAAAALDMMKKSGFDGH